MIAALRDASLRDEAVSVVLDWINHDEHETWLLVTWLGLLDDREAALDVIERLIEGESNGYSSIDALLRAYYLRGDRRFEAAVASLGIPDPPPDVAVVPW